MTHWARVLWSPQVYWPVLGGAVLGLFLLREVWALASHRNQDTLSDYLRALLRIVPRETPAQWDAAAFLSFGMFVVLCTWLAFHIWLHRFS